jgi:hypothetical protein
MKTALSTPLGRRNLFRLFVTAAAVAAADGVAVFDPAAATPGSRSDKQRARYQPNSLEVQTFYRVNHYPAP